MLDSIGIGSSGLKAFSDSLKIIGNNVTNLNTPGYKATDAQFASLMQQHASGQPHGGANQSATGAGVQITQTEINFASGETRQTGNPLDLAISGEGFFILKDKNSGQLVFTRSGQFEFNKEGVMVERGSGREVVGLDAQGAQQSVTVNGLRISAPVETKQVKLTGNVSLSADKVSVDNIQYVDHLGGTHTLKLELVPKTGSPGTWVASVLDGSATVGTAEVAFAAGRPAPGQDQFEVSYSPVTGGSGKLKFSLGQDVTSYDTGKTGSSLAIASADGRAVGSLTKLSVDANGALALSYSNGDTAKGSRIGLAMFDQVVALKALDGSHFLYESGEGMSVGKPGDRSLGTIVSSQVEGSNVELATEFSDLIIAQRGYQAASRIVSTANEMLQDLMEMKGHR